MNNLEIMKVFTEEDMEFNKKMVNKSLNVHTNGDFPDRRGGKMLMNTSQKGGGFQNRNYDFTSDILEDFRRKWGISE